MARSFRVFAAAVAAASVLLAGCSTDSDSNESGHSNDHAAIQVSEAWVKAADDGMTAAFAELKNGTEATLTITKVTSNASPDTQLHETVTDDQHNSMMQEVTAGFTLEPEQELLLEPGGNHIMLMDLSKPLKPGEEVTFTFHFSDGSAQNFKAIVKEFEGANESYESHGKKH